MCRCVDLRKTPEIRMAKPVMSPPLSHSHSHSRSQSPSPLSQSHEDDDDDAGTSHDEQLSPQQPLPEQTSSHVGAGLATSTQPLKSLGQKRRRVTRACDECRRKKIKCDGKQPCTHCTVYSYGQYASGADAEVRSAAGGASFRSHR